MGLGKVRQHVRDRVAGAYTKVMENVRRTGDLGEQLRVRPTAHLGVSFGRQEKRECRCGTVVARRSGRESATIKMRIRCVGIGGGRSP